MSYLIQKIRDNLIGERQAIETPFGYKPLVYMDYTASGRNLHFVEDFIRDKVMPNYANTHSESSFTGKQMTLLREQARQQVREAVNGHEDHKVIFCGSGASSAIEKIIGVLGLSIPSVLEEKYAFGKQIENPTVVFLGPYEHHSNDLQWRESTAKVVRIGLTPEGLIDVEQLERQLVLHKDHTQKIGTFSAASNVTGLKSDVAGITALLHKYDALAFWDYAAAAPYVSIDMQGMSLDAIFLSPHKLVGGPGTPGILVADKKIFHNKVPVMPGGGTVNFVSGTRQSYLSNIESREEGGTPAIIESIRAGLVFKLQQAVGTDLIEKNEQGFVSRVIARWKDNPSIEVLGNLEADRLAIVSFRLLHKSLLESLLDEKELHYGLVVAMLNDVFGIQARGGCSCAGPYGHVLLGIDEKESEAFAEEASQGNFLTRPGWTRMNFNYFLDEATFEYTVKAVEMIAEFGHKLAKDYVYNADTGTWNYLGKSISCPVNLEDFLSQSAFSEKTTKENNESFKESWCLDRLTSQAKGILTCQGVKLSA